MVYRLGMFLTIHVSVVISRNHRAVCVQLLLALVSRFEPAIRAKLKGKRRPHMYKFMKHKIISTLEIALLDVADVHQWSKVNFPFCCFVCLLYDLLTFLFHCRLFIWNQHCLG